MPQQHTVRTFEHTAPALLIGASFQIIHLVAFCCHAFDQLGSIFPDIAYWWLEAAACSRWLATSISVQIAALPIGTIQFVMRIWERYETAGASESATMSQFSTTFMLISVGTIDVVAQKLPCVSAELVVETRTLVERAHTLGNCARVEVFIYRAS
jgi:hypothetical protein